MPNSHQTPKSSSNRKHKDSLFVDYFSKDRDWKKHFLSLYNALHGTDLQVETTKLERVNIKQVLYKTYYNDISVLVNGQLLVLIEHQSTINPNMPLRLLEYVTRVYSKLINSDKKFSEKQQPLPLPEFYVFYTGKDSFPPESVLKLSDSFIKPKDKDLPEYPLELVVKVCKIRGRKPSPILHRCPDLEQYMKFLDLVALAIKRKETEPLTWAINDAIKQGILTDYLERNGEEVLSILMRKYDYETDIRVKQQEAYEDGLEQGREEGLSMGLEQGLEQGAYQNKLETAKAFLAEGLAPAMVARCTNLPLETITGLLPPTL